MFNKIKNHTKNRTFQRRLMLVVILVVLLLICSIFSTIPVTAQYGSISQKAQNNTNDDEPDRNTSNTRASANFTEDIHDYGLDIDEDELFDFLIIEINVTITEPGSYELGSKLMLSDEYPIIYVYKQFETEQEYIIIELQFDGEHIYAAGASEHYLCKLWLETADGEIISEREYKTNLYEFTDFKHSPPPIIITDRTESYGKDTNRNGLFDFLTFELEVEVIEPGEYLIIGGLFKESDKLEEEVDKDEINDQDDSLPLESGTSYFPFLITSNRRFVNFIEGFQRIKLNFNGPAIRQSELDGPYLIGLWLERIENLENYKDLENLSAEEQRELNEMIKNNLLWPMVGEGDLSGDIIFRTKYYSFKDFEEPPKIVRITKRIDEKPIDLDDNGLYDFLRLSIVINITQSGIYLIVGRIITRDEWFELSAKNLTHKREGLHRVNLDFKGVEIHESRLEGYFTIVITVSGETSNEIPIIDRVKFETKRKYSYKEFEQLFKEKDIIEFKEDFDGITTKTDVIEMHTTRTRPEIHFWYSESDTTEKQAKFTLLYSRLIGYKDYNRNGRYDFGEELYVASLLDTLWEINDLTYSVNSIYGNYVMFELSSDITLHKIEEPSITEPESILEEELKGTRQESVDSTQEPLSDEEEINREKDLLAQNQPNVAPLWGRMVFEFLLTTNDFTLGQPFEYKINGGTEVKIDINLEFFKPIDISGIALEQILFDESKNYGFKTNEAPQNWVHYPSEFSSLTKNEITDNKEELNLFLTTPDQAIQMVKFIDNSEKEFGFYSWVNKINVTYFDGRTEIVQINTSYILDGTVLILFTNYPYRRDFAAINHDPSIGMVKESRPKQKETMDEIVKILFNPWFYVIACVAALVFLGLLRKSQMRQKREPTKKERSTRPRQPTHSHLSDHERMKRY